MYITKPQLVAFFSHELIQQHIRCF